MAYEEGRRRVHHLPMITSYWSSRGELVYDYLVTTQRKFNINIMSRSKIMSLRPGREERWEKRQKWWHIFCLKR